MQSTNTSLSGRATPSRHTPLRGGKRKRTLLEESEERSSSDYSVSGTARGDVEITEADPQGRFVKLTNKGNKVRLKALEKLISILFELQIIHTLCIKHNLYNRK